MSLRCAYIYAQNKQPPPVLHCQWHAGKVLILGLHPKLGMRIACTLAHMIFLCSAIFDAHWHIFLLSSSASRMFG